MLLGLLMGSALPIAVVGETNHPSQVVTVLKVNNGQEVLVDINGEGRAVRLACIQAPLQQQQPWSAQAKSALSKALPQGTAVKMELQARDVYWHVVARLLKKIQTLPHHSLTVDESLPTTVTWADATT